MKEEVDAILEILIGVRKDNVAKFEAFAKRLHDALQNSGRLPFQ